MIWKTTSTIGAFDEDAGVETRGRIILDKEGMLHGYNVLTLPVGRNVEGTIRQVQAFQLDRET